MVCGLQFVDVRLPAIPKVLWPDILFSGFVCLAPVEVNK